jgi:flagellar basal body-associated protein FliL
MAKKTAEKSNTAAKVSIGVGVTAALLSAAGAYFLYGSKDAAKNRKTVKSWMLKAKAEVLEGIEKAQDLSKEDYEAMAELAQFAGEMKAHWKGLEKKGQVKKLVQAVSTKKPMKKGAKKSA